MRVFWMLAVVLGGVLMAGETAQAEVVRLRVVDLDVEQRADEVVVTIEAEAEGSGAKIGSFYLFMPQTSHERTPSLPGFDTRGRLPRLLSKDMDQPNFLHLPNGALDEDPAEHRFRVTLDTSEWPEGVYRFAAGVDSRPVGERVHMHHDRPFEIVIGDPQQEQMPPVSNLAEAEHQMLFKEEGYYAAFPSLIESREGDLYTSFRARIRATHSDRTGRTVKLRSADGARTWEQVDEVPPDQRWWTEDGRVVWPQIEPRVEVSDEKREELEQQGLRVTDVRPGTIAYQRGASVQISEDGGQTWRTKPIEVPDRVAGFVTHQRDSALVNSSEGIIYAVYGRRHAPGDPTDHGPSEIFLIRSDASVEQWYCVPMFPDGLTEEVPGLNETSLIEVEPGQLLAVMRTDEHAQMYQSVSTDGGWTWSVPESTGVWGFPGHLLRLSDGRVLLTYGYRREPLGIRAVLSEDGGRTWQTDRTFVLRNDGFYRLGDLGYPLTSELADGTLFTIYYFTTFESGGLTHIAGTRWRPELREDQNE